MKKGIIITLSALLGMLIGVTVTGIVKDKQIKSKKNELNKFHKFYDILIQWLLIKQKGSFLTAYFVQRGYKTVALYGMKELGERLYDELKESEVEVKYIIDKNADSIYSDVDVFTPDEVLMDVDVIIVTAVYYFDEIKGMLEQKIDCPILSLEDIVYGI